MRKALHKLISLWFYPIVGIIYAAKDRELDLDTILGFIQATPYVWRDPKTLLKMWHILYK